MKIIFYLGHPSQFHFSKNIISELERRNHEVLVLIKTKDILEYLLEKSGFDYINIQPQNESCRSQIRILYESIIRTIKVTRIATSFKPDIMVGTDSSIAQSGFLLGVKTYTVLEDDFSVIKKLAVLTYPFSTKIITPNVCDVDKWCKKKIGYDGYMKLAYLHPSYFTPDYNVVRKYIPNSKYWLIRIVSLKAYHDENLKGFSVEFLNQVIEKANSSNVKVFISSEEKLVPDFKEYELKINPEDIHHVLYYSEVLISDSQSMSVEAALLGTPSLRLSDFSGKISVLEELEHKYNLTFGFKTGDEELLLNKLDSIIKIENLKNDFQERRLKMLNEKIDVTKFFVELIEKEIELTSTKDFTLKKYRELILSLQKSNYSFIRFEDYLSGIRFEKFVILRHDVDLKAENSLQVAKIENELGVKSSYYFRVVPQSNKPEIIKQIAEMGHEIGYHYEDMDLFNGDIEKAYEHFKNQLEYFRQYYHVKTISMHGSPRSKFDNKDLWQKYDYKKLGIIGEPYFDLDTESVSYLTDTGRMWDGQKYSVRDKMKSLISDYHSTNQLLEAIRVGKLPSKIMITTHPQRWTNDKIEWLQERITQSVKNAIKYYINRHQ